MSEYTPDKWVIVKIQTKDGEVIHKVLGSWFGGYLDSDHWRMNSGITEIKREGDDLEFIGYSGSTYHCNINNIGMSSHTCSVAESYQIDLREKYSATFNVLDSEALETYLESYSTS